MMSDETLSLPPVTDIGPDAADGAGPGRAVRRQRTEPVFVDASGRRRRRVRRLGAGLAVLGVGYVVLLLSTVLGGPSVRMPLLPAPPAATVRPAHPGPQVSGPAARHTPAGTPRRPAAAAPSAAPGTQPGASTTALPSTTRSTTAAPVAAPSTAAPTTTKAHGRPTTAPGHRPTTHP